MSVKIIECPRDAMQGMDPFIPTEKKAAYINQLLKVGFDTIDFGSFVSPKAIPQLRDTAEVLSMLNLENAKSKLLAIVANTRGAQDACNFEEIDYLGYPFSISETFQLRNTNATIDQSLSRVEEMQSLCVQNKKKMVVYISMAFGNPYGDPWSGQLAAEWTEKLTKDLGIEIIALADTVGVSNGDNITELFSTLIPAFPKVEIGAHLHTLPEDAKTKAKLAYDSGCRRFDAALKGYGGCPMAEDDLVGNMATELLIDALSGVDQLSIDEKQFIEAMMLAGSTFPS
ncbi:hydroxymethylglutaryl-CoA lyase [Salibacteraceae bacterium]|nr:hydroxymethylglutaryl-CoA lyase [Salibacteraceae bacterium]MDB4105726.1 hydroxymethylglutaryl-CoA lyase [Salibacteraceae bacterium]MDB9710093.1 hydroxymethylglutaryl-CoA lyase [Salibacteraceae bacterium]